jgi:hypothetical protein
MTPKRTPGRKQKPVDAEGLKLARLTMRLGKRILRTWDATAAHYGISKAAAHRLANDPQYRPSQATIDKVLAAPQPVPPLVPVHPCPSCADRGIVRSHADGLDCHGNGGTAVVLAPGETVRRAGQSRPRRRYFRPCLPASLTPEQRRLVVAYAVELAGPVPGAEVQ